ncbi:MAG TPA: tetratricopeptide repeat protein [Candidatus Sulfotelmatobacter sp.]|nr:tetratricopeptide repeat protein [Candidatus Sulfotelmatobacter sp.]
MASALLASGGAQDVHPLNERFQSAVASYEAGHLPEAAAQLESLLRDTPNSFEVHELLGLVYAGESQAELANRHLQQAVRLKPNSAAARTNLATNFIHSGNLAAAEEQLKKAVALEPQNFDANHNLGEVYVRLGRLSDAIAYLKQAQRINGSSYENGYDLALAYLSTGHPAPAREVVQKLLQTTNAAELHNLLAQIEEKDGNYVTAVNEYEVAAHLDPSEGNLFDWGSELLIHQTLEPAIEVFRRAAERYPNSTRIAIGLGIAYYSRGIYDEAVKSLLRAADLSPSDPRCYLFLSKAYDSSPTQADEVIQRFRRFSELQPNDARAAYYYAMSLWKGKRAQDSSVDFQQIESLLKRAIALEPKLYEAHFHLGNLYSDQSHYAEAVPEYVKALDSNPNLPDAHYRLGQAYVHTGQKDKAQAQFAIYQEQRAQHLADLDKQRADIRQFVYSESAGAAATQ